MKIPTAPLLRRRTIELPEQIDSVVRIADDEVDPADAGLRDDATEAIWAAALAWYRSATQPFISLCIRRRGKVVLRRSVGHSHGNGPGETGTKKIGTPDTPVALFSASKMVTGLLIHALAERKHLELDKPVAAYLPQFAANGKKDVSIRDVLSHRAGMPQMPADFSAQQGFDFDATVDRLCAEPAVSRYQRRQAYHAATGGYILGAAAQRATGESLPNLLAEVFSGPLDLDVFGYGCRPAHRKLVARNYSTGPDQVAPMAALARRALGAPWDSVVDMSNRAEFFSSLIPAVNLIATADEVSRFLQMMLDKGRANGRRILRPSTVRGAVEPYASGGFDHMLLVPLRFSAGFMLGASPVGLFGPLTRQAYGHLGFISIFCWADPQRDTSVALLSSGKSLYGQHLLPLAALLNAISWHCYTN